MTSSVCDRRASAGAALTLLLAAALPAAAQSPATSATSPAAGEPTLAPVTVRGEPSAPDLEAPAWHLDGEALQRASRASLGETLASEPGVSSTYFGPQSSRPVLRGLDGERVRILNNGASLGDVSALSADHAVAVDPIAVERIELLRGPAALRYGGHVGGGVVNLVDNRIPTEPMGGANGRVDLGADTGNRQGSGAVLLEGGSERVGLHVDAYERRSGELRAPLALSCTQGGVTRVASRVCNSDGAARGGAVGGSLFFDQGRIGASVAEHRSSYGSPAEDEVRVGLVQRRQALEGEFRPRSGPWAQVTAQWTQVDYRHTEFEGGQAGTRFGQRSHEWRLDARHHAWAGWHGHWGLQGSRADFSADGEEVFAPYSRSHRTALYAHETRATAWGEVGLGLRREQVSVASDGHPTVDRFVVGERRFTPTSVALSALHRLPKAGWSITGQLARTERAPSDAELYADGPHVATAAWERGDASLPTERALHAEGALAWTQGPERARLALHTTRFAHYIALLPTGGFEGGLPEYRYASVAARLTGLEGSGSTRLPWRGPADGALDVQWRGEVLRADNLDTGEALPRIAPWRVGATLLWSREAWTARAGFDHHGREDRVPTGQLATPGYTLWHAGVTHRLKLGRSQVQAFAQLENASDRLAYSATSILTQTVPGRVPLPGRSLRVGLRADF